MTTFDGVARIITLTAGGSVHTVNVQVDLYSDWKEWVKTGNNADYPQAFDTDGGAPLTDAVNQGSYYFLRNDLGWRIRPAEEDATINVIGNLVARDSSLPLTIPTIGDFTVLLNGLQPITQSVDKLLTEQLSAGFNGKVAIDTIYGVSGTSGTTGYASNPVNNLADAITIATRETLRDFTLRGTITLTQAFEDWSFEGVSAGDADIINLNGQSIDGSKLVGVKLGGAGSGMTELIRCNIDAVSGIYGLFRQCGFLNSCTLGLGSTTFHQCFSEVNGDTKPWVSLNGLASTFGNRDWVGGFEMRGVSNVNALVSLDCPAGRLELDSTNTNGEIVLGGAAALTDNSGAGCTVLDYALLSPEKQQRILKATAWKQFTNASTGKLDIYDEDDNLDQSVDIFEDNGVTSWDGAGPIVRRDKIT